MDHPPAGLLRRFEALFLRRHRPAIALALAAMVAQAVLLLPVPLLQGRVIDRLFALPIGSAPAKQAAEMTRAILLALAAMAACHAGRMLLGWKAAAMMSRVGLDVARDLTDAMHRKLQALPLSYFDRQQTGRLMARMTGDVGSLLVFLNGGSLQLASDLVLAAGIAAALLWLQWPLGLLALVILPLYALNQRRFARRLDDLAIAARARLAAIFDLLGERLPAVRVVRASACEPAELAELDRRLDAHRAAGLDAMNAGSHQAALAALISGVATLALLALGAGLLARGRLTAGDLVAFLALAANLLNPLARLSGLGPLLAGTRVAVERMAEVLDEPRTLADRPGARRVRRPRGALSYDNISFAYAADQAPVLEAIDLHIEPGMKIGLLGPSGSGKSTLLSLAPRLYDLAEGQGGVRLDGRDVRSLRLADLRRAVMLAPQDAVLFGGTVGANLTYAAPRATPAAIRRVLEAADLAATVASWPLGLETPVGRRGESLSGGQRQRLALARALLADPAVLLLDDTTSALDPETESRVHAALAELRHGRTLVVASPKTAALADADLILVLRSGRITERGNHDQLLRLGGAYAAAHRLPAWSGRPLMASSSVR